MNKFFVFLLLLVFTATVFAQTPLTQLTEREKIILKIDREIEDDTVIEVLRKINNNILKSVKDNTPLSSLKYSSFASIIDSFVKYRWFIADTGLSKKWLKKVHALLVYMHKTQSYLAAARFSGHTQTAKYQQAVKYFAVAYGRFVKLIKKPVKVSGKLQRQVKGKKLVWQKNMRKKYKIEKKSTNGTN